MKYTSLHWPPSWYPTMPTLNKIVTSARNAFSKTPTRYSRIGNSRTYADHKDDGSLTKQVVSQGGVNNLRLRVRRARPSDTPRVLRFVREQVRYSWPGLVTPPPASQTVLDDHMARTLAQGHTMLVEQHEPRLGWSSIQGVALSCAVSPWDAALLEKFAKCVRCPKARQVIDFSAHCLRGPELHHKYGVHRILQVILIVTPNLPITAEVAMTLAKNAIKRGRETGFPLIRFDVNNKIIANVLSHLELKREWHLAYEVLPDKEKYSEKKDTLFEETKRSGMPEHKTQQNDEETANFVTVYTKKFLGNNAKL